MPSSELPENNKRSVDLVALCRVPGPSDPARPRRLDWATLLRRSFAIDVLTCPRCLGPMRLIAVIEAPVLIRRILGHLGHLGHLGLDATPARAGPRLVVDADLVDQACDAYDGVDRPAHLD